MSGNRALISGDFEEFATKYIKKYQNQPWFVAKRVLGFVVPISAIATLLLQAAIRPSCINGSRIGPPSIPAEWQTIVIAATIMLIALVAWKLAKMANQDWLDNVGWAQQLALDLKDSHCVTRTLNLVPDHVLTSAGDLEFDDLEYMLIVPVDQQRTACILLHEDLDDIRSTFKSEVKVSYLPRTGLLTSMEFEGDNIRVNERLSRHDNEYIAKLSSLQTGWFALGQITDVSFPAALRLLDQVEGEGADESSMKTSKAQQTVAI